MGNIVTTIKRFLSNKKMLEDEDRAKHSSNYQGE